MSADLFRLSVGQTLTSALLAAVDHSSQKTTTVLGGFDEAKADGKDVSAAMLELIERTPGRGLPR
jgi:hypothetical protein